MNRTIDTYPDFLSYWEKYSDTDLESRIQGWAGEYMSRWPELFQKQIDDCRGMGADWRKVAADRVFPFLHDRIEDMNRARALLSVMIQRLHGDAEETFGMEMDILYVLYVGTGCGAGRVTELNGSQAILLDLGMIAEGGWTGEDSLMSLLAHELGHAAHGIMRRDPGLSGGDGPFWQLYTEGFAQRGEHMIMQRDSWNAAMGMNRPDWLQWCGDNRSWLAGEFLQVAEKGGDVGPSSVHGPRSAAGSTADNTLGTRSYWLWRRPRTSA